MNFQKNILFTVLALFILFPAAGAGALDKDSISVSSVEGDALIRELGDYFWCRPRVGKLLDAGDRVRLRRGEFQMALPHGTLAIYDEGELELPARLVDGFAEPWANDIRLYIGDYGFDLNVGADGRPLRLITLFGEIEAQEKARFTVRITPRGSEIFVQSGRLTVRHRLAKGKPFVTLAEGDAARVSMRGIR